MTAIEYLAKELQGKGWGNISISIPEDLINQAKKMEQLQIENAFLEGKKEIVKVFNNGDVDSQITGEEYYKQTYGL